jgi:type I restriction enzyme, S subunit
MSNTNENNLVPKFRFPEFINDGEWKVKKLEDVCEINPKVAHLPDEFVYIDLESVEKGMLLQKKIIKKEEAPSRAQRLLEDNDVVFQMVRPYQKNNYYFKKNDDYDYVASTGYAQLRAYESSMFLFQFIHTDSFVSSVLEKCTGSNYPAINSSDLSQIALEIPRNPKEQQKIAACLSSLDEVITFESQKLKVLKEHKKGLLQNLFPQAGETVPKLRFKEFADSGDWEYLNGNELFKPITNKNHNSDLPILAITQDKGAVPRELIDYTVIATEKSIESYKVVEIGDFIISLRSFQGGIEYSNYKGICSPAYIILRKKINLVDIFFKYYLKTDLYIQNLNKNIEGIRDGKMVSYKQFSEILLPLPKNKEQQKIASCLSSIDDLINAQSQKVETLKLHKKGLLQGLFPTISD